MNCSRSDCREKASHECTCERTKMYFCQNDLLIHMSSCRRNHNTVALEKKLNREVVDYVKSSLEKLRSDLQQKKKLVMNDFSRCITLLEERGRTVLKLISDHDRSLEEVLVNLKTDPSTIVNSNLEKILEMTLEQVKTECKDWDLISLQLNTENLRRSITEWSYIESDLEYLFSNGPKKSKGNLKSSSNNGSNCQNSEEFKISKPEVNDENYPKPVTFKESIHQSSSKSINRSSTTIFKDDLAPSKSDFTRSNSMKIVKCKKDHLLNWNWTLPFAYYKKFGNFVIKCDSCGTTYSKAGFNCLECCYDLCEKCAAAQGLVCPKLVCLNQHDLLWRCDASMHNEMNQKGHSFVCRNCNKRKDEPHWYCHPCEFDVCQECASSRGIHPIVSSPICKNSHRLAEAINNKRNINGLIVYPKCSVCESNFEGKCLYCSECGFMSCQKCSAFMYLPPAGHPVLRCASNHLLRWNPKSEFICDYCCRKKNQERFRCQYCNFDVCSECSEVMVKIMMEDPKKTHGEGHPLHWNQVPSKKFSNGNVPECPLCHLKFPKAGMFECSICDRFYCVLCYDNPQRPKPQISNRDINQNLTNLLLLSALLNRGN